MATPTKPAPETAPAPAPPVVSPPPTLGQALMSPAPPWFVMPWGNFLALLLFGLVCWIMYILAPAKHEAPSQLFNMLCQAIVLTAFIGGPVAVAYTISRDNQKKADATLAQASAIAAQNSASQPGA